MTDSKRTTRRDFLAGRPQSGRESEEADDRQNASDSTPSWQTAYLTTFSKKAMACEFAVYLNADQFQQGPDTALTAFERIDQLESRLSTYRPESLISRINETAFDHPVAVDEETWSLLSLAWETFSQTEGAFDITSGPLIKMWGFYDRQPRVPSEEAIEDALARVGSERLLLHPENRTVSFAHPHVEINLAGIGKGFALDRCGEIFDEAGVRDFIIHGGQSSVLASGNRAAESASEDEGWTVAVSHPLLPQTRLGNLVVRDRALATSGSGRQALFHRGRRLGHIIDPRTGWPTEGVLSTTVLAPTSAQADALATAFFVMGLEKAHEYCNAHPDVGALFVLPGKRQGAIETVAIQLPDSVWIPH